MNCYYCGDNPCTCELAPLNFPRLRREIARAFRNGTKDDRLLTAETGKALLRCIAEKDAEIARLRGYTKPRRKRNGVLV